MIPEFKIIHDGLKTRVGARHIYAIPVEEDEQILLEVSAKCVETAQELGLTEAQAIAAWQLVFENQQGLNMMILLFESVVKVVLAK